MDHIAEGQLKQLVSDIKTTLPYGSCIGIDHKAARVVNKSIGRVIKDDRDSWKFDREYNTLDNGTLGKKYDNSKDISEKQAVSDEVYNTYKKIGSKLAKLGITMNFAPVLDLSHPAMQCGEENRAFSTKVDTVIALGKSAVRG